MSLLVEHEQAPRYEICLMRGEDVLREHRLYARAAAQMVADTWRSATLKPTIQRSTFNFRLADSDF